VCERDRERNTHTQKGRQRDSKRVCVCVRETERETHTQRNVDRETVRECACGRKGMRSGVVLVSRIDKMIGLFCKRAL